MAETPLFASRPEDANQPPPLPSQPPEKIEVELDDTPPASTTPMSRDEALANAAESAQRMLETDEPRLVGEPQPLPPEPSMRIGREDLPTGNAKDVIEDSGLKVQ